MHEIHSKPVFINDVINIIFFFLVLDSSESVREECVVILTKMLCCEVRKILLQSADIVQLVVHRIMVSQSQKGNSRCSQTSVTRKWRPSVKQSLSTKWSLTSNK